MTILQYSNTGNKVDVKVEPHKNSKRNCQPYHVTATSARKCIEQKVQSQMGSSSIFNDLYESSGGVLENTSFASHPRDVNQVKYERKKLREQHSKDTLSKKIDKCKPIQ